MPDNQAGQRRGIPTATNVDHVAWTVAGLERGR